jgi:hypothetical protein
MLQPLKKAESNGRMEGKLLKCKAYLNAKTPKEAGTFGRMGGNP